ncbi:type II toxin-antitoxin system HicA family toxin [Pedobacter metabolipauper]|uniref:type II toxin-antitoxin system HicA family toxin n=1 Tax=Pedobacter metabolipauper TaxID=425513 RepID=UPI00106198F9
MLKFYSNPKDLSWHEAIKVLNHYGFYEIRNSKTGGSRRKFVNQSDDVICLHHPHPSVILKKYQIDLIQLKLIHYEKLF